MSGYATFELGDLALQCGRTLPEARLAYKTYGMLAPDKSNVILYPTSYGAHHTDIDWLIAPGRVLDPERYFIVIPNQLGNGLSSSPSNLVEPFGPGRARGFRHGRFAPCHVDLPRATRGSTAGRGSPRVGTGWCER